MLVLVVLILACQHISCLTFGFIAKICTTDFFLESLNIGCRQEGTMWDACLRLVSLINNHRDSTGPGCEQSCWVQNEQKLLWAMFFLSMKCFSRDFFSISFMINNGGYHGCKWELLIMIFCVPFQTWTAATEKCYDGMCFCVHNFFWAGRGIENIDQLFTLTCQSCRIQRKSCFS